MSVKKPCSLAPRRPLWSVMMRLLLVLAASACGGFNTPPQEVSTGLALSRPVLPPRVEKDGHVLVLTSIEATVAASAEEHGDEHVVEAAHPFTTSLTQSWSELARGDLPRGEYGKVKLSLSALAVSGTFDGAAFRVAATEERTFELSCDGWRVELGRSSAVSLVADPAVWMSKKKDGDGLEPLDPADSEAASGLMSRFMESLAAVRDDDHDGVEDPDSH